MARLALAGQQRGAVPVALTWRRDDWLSANLVLQQALNPLGETVSKVVMEGTAGAKRSVELRLGDHVACTANLAHVRFFNGMTGRVLDREDNTLTLRTEDGRIIKLSIGDAHCLELGYCLTVHRAQGGEWPHVLVYLPNEVKGDPQSWYYTAVSRARSRVDVVSSLAKDELWKNMFYSRG